MAFDGGSAFATEDFSGVALWPAPGMEPEEAALVAVIGQNLEPRKREPL